MNFIFWNKILFQSSDSTLLKHLRLIYTSPEGFGETKNILIKLVSISTYIDKVCISYVPNCKAYLIIMFFWEF